MSKSMKINGTTYNIHTNRHTRPLYAMLDVADDIRSEFDYIPEDDYFTARLFQYRGSWYDAREFESAPDNVRAMGFDAIQTESYFSAVVVSWFERDGYELEDEVIVGYIHW